MWPVAVEMLDNRFSRGSVQTMKCRFSRFICLFLAAAVTIGGVMGHATTFAHAAPGQGGVLHDHSGHGEHGAVDRSGEDQNGSGHTRVICVDAHCCAPAVHIASQDILRHPLAGGKLVVGPASNYALSIALSLLKPPRTTA
jgi:hypothetical protein